MKGERWLFALTHYSLFDIIGPVMIGPSSSHTAGAAKLGLAAKEITGEPIVSVDLILHGSFATTGHGHGTRLALLAGLLGLHPDDENLRQAEQLAQAAGIQYTFRKGDLGDVHPNSARFDIKGESGAHYVITGSSIGGGAIEITEVNGMEVSFSGEYITMMTLQEDKFGVISTITAMLAASEVNVAAMRLFRSGRGKLSVMVLELDQMPPKGITSAIEQLPAVKTTRVVPALVF